MNLHKQLTTHLKLLKYKTMVCYSVAKEDNLSNIKDCQLLYHTDSKPASENLQHNCTQVLIP